MPENVARSFAPIAGPGARVLILGSMPGRASLEAQQYYAYPHNAFWPIMAALLDFDPELPYAARTEALVARGIALWDVLHTCEREGSLDSSIVETSIVPNDFAEFFREHGGVRTVFFNGTKAEAAFWRYVLPQLERDAIELETTRLPSTSPAHASLRFKQKLASWRVVADALSA